MFFYDLYLRINITGHRSIDKKDFEEVSKHLEVEIERLISLGVTSFCAGGALGFDTLSAGKIIDFKNRFPQIKLVLVLPCKTQTNGWSEVNKNEYNFILERADEVIYTSEKYYTGCMHTRNRKMVELSAYCIAYLHTNAGGTFYTVQYAKSEVLRLLMCRKICRLSGYSVLQFSIF